jgi:hypothetical protein
MLHARMNFKNMMAFKIEEILKKNNNPYGIATPIYMKERCLRMCE